MTTTPHPDSVLRDVDQSGRRSMAGSLRAQDFKLLSRRRLAGVAVTTAVGPDEPVALTATSVSSVCANDGEPGSVAAAHRAQLAALWR